ncbi:MAG: hypothetical protein Q9183_007508, partial [Haloplaca sp. 2 TL-2023]
VRSPATSANLVLSLKVPRDGVIVPEIQSQTVAMTQKSTVGPYNIVSATYALDAIQVQSTTFDVTLGSGAADTFKSTGDLGTTCVDLDSTGCYTDSASKRVLTGRATASREMTQQACANYCSGWTYWGVEYGSQCYCGNAFSNPTTSTPASDCSFKCSGDATQVCGGTGRMSLFKSSKPSASNATIPGYSYTGCYTDSTAARVLKDRVYYDNALTIE